MLPKMYALKMPTSKTGDQKKKVPKFLLSQFLKASVPEQLFECLIPGLSTLQRIRLRFFSVPVFSQET